MSDQPIQARSDTGGQTPGGSGSDVGETDPVDSAEGLFDFAETSQFSSRWHEIQARFVDQPQESVAAADALVDDVVATFTTRLAEQRRQLEVQWQRDEAVSTEELRRSFQRYRELFDRLLAGTSTAP